MHGGDVLNSIPGEARATIDMRGWHDADLDWAEAQLLRVRPAPRRDVHDGDERLVTPPLERTAAVAALAAQAAALGDALGSPVPETSTGGVSDGCWTAGAGLPTLDGLGPVGALDHSPDEYIEIAVARAALRPRRRPRGRDRRRPAARAEGRNALRGRDCRLNSI